MNGKDYKLVVEFPDCKGYTDGFGTLAAAIAEAQLLPSSARWEVFGPKSDKPIAMSPRDGVSENAQKAGRKLANSLTPAQRKAKAQAAARARWGKKE